MKSKISFSLILLLLCTYLMGLHFGTIVEFEIEERELRGKKSEKLELLHNHLLLHGSSYKRGVDFGKLTKTQLLEQEQLMTKHLDKFIPSKFVQELLFFGSMIWFQGLDSFVDKESLLEMQGVSKSTDTKFDSYGSPLTRQLAYHAIHEVGQMFVDNDRGDMGCFSTIIKNRDDSFVIGRNFDFDIDSYFRKNFFLKWSFPNNEDLAYVSVIWAGMVGAVTGVNDKGVYVAINAAGSDDFSRVGTPTTLIVKNVLSKASSLDQAIEIIKNKKSFITETFVVGSHQGVAVIEKTPLRSNVSIVKSNTIVSNHLTSEEFKDDEINIKRQRELTTKFRHNRGLELLKNSTLLGVEKTISILRDKKIYMGQEVQLGNRGAIDSLIASHSTIYDERKSLFYVNTGPGSLGHYIGYDLRESFKRKIPVVSTKLPRDSELSTKRYWEIVNSLEEINRLKKLDLPKNCQILNDKMKELVKLDIVHYDMLELRGDYYRLCENDLRQAKALWNSALTRKPPFKNVVDRLKGKIND